MPYDVEKANKGGMSNRERALGHHKGTVTSVGIGNPTIKDGSEGDFALRKTPSGLKLYVKYANIWNDVNDLSPAVPGVGVPTFASADTAPSVKGGVIFNSGTIPLTITDFSNGTIGQTITVISKEAITYDVTLTNLKGGSVDIVTASGDTTTWIHDGSNWYLISWMDLTADLSSGGF